MDNVCKYTVFFFGRYPLRSLVARILSLEMEKHKVENDAETDPNMRDEVVLELHANLQSQYKLLPKMEVLLHKASEVKRTFKKNAATVDIH